MRRLSFHLGLILACLACTPALAATYPVAGLWGDVPGAPPGPVDCSGKRVIAFNGDQRTDSGGGVPGYHLKSITPLGAHQWRVVDDFTTGQIRNGTVSYTLRQADADHLDMDLQRGGTLTLRKCK
jgi:hypothetical protein